VTITFVREGASRSAFFVIELTNAVVQDISIGASNDRASENVSFAFETITLTDIRVDASGKFGGTVVISCDVKSLKCS
jgi:type VI protein secretion system component Hcp